jgi:fatty acid desaturase
MYNWGEIDPKHRAANFKYKMKSSTKWDYIGALAINLIWVAMVVVVIVAVIFMMRAIILPIMGIVIGFVIVCVVFVEITEKYSKFNAKCTKIEMTDEEKAEDGTM